MHKPRPRTAAPPAVVPIASDFVAYFTSMLAYLGFDFDLLYYGLHKGNPNVSALYAGGGACNSKKSFLELLEEFSHTIAPGEHPYTRHFTGDGFPGKVLPVGCTCLFLDCATFVVFYTMAKRLIEDPGATVAGLKLPLMYTPITEKEPSEIAIMKKKFEPYNPQGWYPDRASSAWRGELGLMVPIRTIGWPLSATGPTLPLRRWGLSGCGWPLGLATGERTL